MRPSSSIAKDEAEIAKFRPEVTYVIGFVSLFAYSAGAVVCHQIPERSFFLAGRQLPVCARCTGLYLAAALGLAAWVLFRSARGARWPISPPSAVVALVVAGLPTLLSFLAGVAGWWNGSNVERALLALPLGAAAGVLVAAVATKDLR
jgi:uncharacterized membrane protein